MPGLSTASNRYLWVDYAKGLMIVLVVVSHVMRGLNKSSLGLDPQVFFNVDNSLYLFHMPVFFLLSGLFISQSLARHTTRQFLKQKAIALLYPYIVWSVIQIATQSAMGAAANTQRDLSFIASITYAPVAQFWFLYVLFCLQILTAVALQQAHVKPVFLWVVAVILHIISYSLPYGQVPFLFCRYALFFAAGILLAPRLLSMPAVRLRTIALLAMATATGIVLQLSNHVPYLAPQILPVALLAVAFTVSACLYLAQQINLPWLALLGRYSMPIFLVHILCTAGTRIVLQKVLHVESLPMHILAGVLAGVVIPVLMAKIAERFKLQRLAGFGG